MITILFFITLVSSQSDCPSSFCYDCDTAGCLSCIDNYVLVDGACLPKHDAHCQETYNDRKHCYRCFSGYKLNTNGLCVEGEEHCESGYFDSSDKFVCTSYKCPGQQLYAKGQCLQCKVDNSYCAKLKDDATTCLECERCMPGTAMNSYGVCEMFDEFCKESSGKKCLYCIDGYYLDTDGVCKKGEIKECLVYLNKTVCEKCVNNGYVSNGECVDGCKIENCDICSVNGKTCEKCAKGFGLYGNGKCKEFEGNCGAFDEYGRCNGCKSGYYFNEDKNTCVKCASGCATCIESQSKCATCKVATAVVYNGKCVEKIENCVEYSTEEDGGCLVCEEGYKLASGACTVNKDGCAVKSEERCVKCVDGYYMRDDYTCTKCDDICGGKCYHTATTCFDNEIEGCEKYNSDTECAHCEKDYVLRDGRCEMDYNYYFCIDETITEKCAICVKYKDEKGYLNDQVYDILYPGDMGVCPNAGNGSIMNVIMLLVLVVMFLF